MTFTCSSALMWTNWKGIVIQDEMLRVGRFDSGTPELPYSIQIHLRYVDILYYIMWTCYYRNYVHLNCFFC